MNLIDLPEAILDPEIINNLPSFNPDTQRYATAMSYTKCGNAIMKKILSDHREKNGQIDFEDLCSANLLLLTGLENSLKLLLPENERSGRHDIENIYNKACTHNIDLGTHIKRDIGVDYDKWEEKITKLTHEFSVESRYLKKQLYDISFIHALSVSIWNYVYSKTPVKIKTIYSNNLN